MQNSEGEKEEDKLPKDATYNNNSLLEFFIFTLKDLYYIHTIDALYVFRSLHSLNAFPI